MPYVATKTQKVRAADVDPSALPPGTNPDDYVEVRPGTLLPGAERWPNVGAWEQQNYVQFVPDGEVPAAAPTSSGPGPVTATPEPEPDVHTKGSLSRLNKDALAEFASEDFALALDPDDLTKAEMIDAILEAQG